MMSEQLHTAIEEKVRESHPELRTALDPVTFQLIVQAVEQILPILIKLITGK